MTETTEPLDNAGGAEPPVRLESDGAVTYVTMQNAGRTTSSGSS